MNYPDSSARIRVRLQVLQKVQSKFVGSLWRMCRWDAGCRYWQSPYGAPPHSHTVQIIQLQIKSNDECYNDGNKCEHTVVDVGFILNERILLLFRATRLHVCLPTRCGDVDSFHDFLNTRPSRFVGSPALPHEFPQGVGDPDILRVCGLIWPDTCYDVVRELLWLDVEERELSR